jgi:hypothetical protein
MGGAVGKVNCENRWARGSIDSKHHTGISNNDISVSLLCKINRIIFHSSQINWQSTQSLAEQMAVEDIPVPSVWPKHPATAAAQD